MVAEFSVTTHLNLNRMTQLAVAYGKSNALFHEKSFVVSAAMIMSGYSQKHLATLIANDVVLAYACDCDSSNALNSTVRGIVVGKLVEALFRVLPTSNGAFLATVCNSTLADTLGGMDTGGPRVEMVDPGDGSVWPAP
ncbi:hypothetical protein MKK88_00275 [Methylobacterium sp. E-005]|uniref:hypothetical protein n=1 Tax=Methylobacterium sp. E-005 TaxID=2836549 RepID=UPI001FB861DF|nr:hypothetical protein [Methylobacterium sp. E-005]MCJ2084431.1 hypothetical protein [Methylobacterium sp. E-005]